MYLQDSIHYTLVLMMQKTLLTLEMVSYLINIQVQEVKADVMIVCLNSLLKSVKLWMKQILISKLQNLVK